MIVDVDVELELELAYKSSETAVPPPEPPVNQNLCDRFVIVKVVSTFTR